MILDIIIIILLIIYVLIGRRRGFVLEFIHLFKYILIIYITRLIYEIIKINNKNLKEQLKIYIIIIVIQYILFSAFLFFHRKFFQNMKLKRWDSFLGIIFSIIKVTFIVFIIYVVVLLESFTSSNKKIKEIREKSIVVQLNTKYMSVYSEAFPDFIQKRLDIYRRKKLEKSIEKEVLDELKNPKRKKISKGLGNNENNR